MIIKFIWISLMFLITAGAIFIASFGVDIPVAYYDRVENVMANRQQYSSIQTDERPETISYVN